MSGGAISSELSYPISPSYQISRKQGKEMKRKYNMNPHSNSKERYTPKERNTNLNSSMQNQCLSLTHTSMNSPKDRMISNI